MLDHKAFGPRIRFRRMELDLSQEDLAELAGVSTSFIGLLNAPRNRPSWTRMTP